ncbi:hypothetical protein T265_01770 [Opisthorchis viverrini]|uniref:Uncharacterized protein n=1 Tax=Opisthorchis viverrini TaxID=6198 RepID=A0A074ZYN7_OPIVI|nr:hypothetical protein T265_01770 [Opisthorchis viverrini]KER32156.1 hypothetical protein T265_01770 [Opisthorchis viverrini]
MSSCLLGQHEFGYWTSDVPLVLDLDVIPYFEELNKSMRTIQLSSSRAPRMSLARLDILLH